MPPQKMRSTSSFPKFYFCTDYTSFFDKMQGEILWKTESTGTTILWCRYPAKREIRR